MLPTAQLMYIKVNTATDDMRSVNDYVYIQVQRLLDQMEFVKVCFLCVLAPLQSLQGSWQNIPDWIQQQAATQFWRYELCEWSHGRMVGQSNFLKRLQIWPIKNEVWKRGSKSCAHH